MAGSQECGAVSSRYAGARQSGVILGRRLTLDPKVHRIETGGERGTRTLDLAIMSRAL